MLRLVRHTGTKPVLVPIFPIIGKTGYSTGFGPVLENDVTQERVFRDKNDKLRSSKPLNKWSERSCYHNHTIATILLTGNREQFLPMPTEGLDHRSRSVDLDDMVSKQRQSSSTNTDGFAPVRGSFLGYSFKGAGGSIAGRADVYGYPAYMAMSSDAIVVSGYRFRYTACAIINHNGKPWCLQVQFRTAMDSGTNYQYVPSSSIHISTLTRKGTSFITEFITWRGDNGPEMTQYPASEPWNTNRPVDPMTHVTEMFRVRHPEYEPAFTNGSYWNKDVIECRLRATAALTEFILNNEQGVLTEILSVMSAHETTEGYNNNPLVVDGFTDRACEWPDYATLRKWNRYVSAFNDVCVLPSPPVSWGVLGNECADQIGQLDINLLGYLLELKDTGSTLKSVYKFFDNPKTVRSAASTWLSLRYGDRLTVADTREIFSSAVDFLSRASESGLVKCRSRRITDVSQGLPSQFLSQTEIQTYGLRTLPKDYNIAMKAVRVLMDWNLWLDTANAWDLVPLSFVIDWFVNVGDCLSAIDRLVTSAYWSVESVTRSRKVVTVLDPTPFQREIPLLTQIEHRYYFREIRGTLDSEPFFIEWSCPNLINVIDGLTLLVQR